MDGTRNYGKVVGDIVRGRPYDKPVLAKDIVRLFTRRFPELPVERTGKIVYEKLSELVKEDVIRRCAKGIYIRTKRYRLGNIIDKTVGITRKEAVVRVLTESDGRKIGYETVPSIMNRVGLSTMMTRRIDIATNKYRRIIPQRVNVAIHKPAICITPENFRYLQIIDLIDGINVYHVDAENPFKIICDTIKKVEIDPVLLENMYKKIHKGQCGEHFLRIIKMCKGA